MASKEEKNISPSSTPPKLSLFSLPNHQLLPEPPGMLTPPLQRAASIPFLWEEAPGKPLLSSSIKTTNLARCLELPPRLLSSEIKLTDLPSSCSPSTVLDGPYVRRSVSARENFSLFEDIGSISKRSESNNKGSNKYFGGGGGGTWGRKGGSKRNTRVCEDNCGISPSQCSSLSFGGFGNVDSGNHTKVKITRIKRTGSFFSLSHSKSHHTHIWASIYGTFKQVVPLPWRTRKTKKEGQSI